MRAEESAYWDDVAVRIKGATPGAANFNDNIWKRGEQVRRILRHRPVDARVLEIGAGHALAAATINLLYLKHLQYMGTDVSPKFCEFVSETWGLPMTNTDILALPDGPFDMVWMFDTLEHVRPEDRAAGYAEISRVLASRGFVLLNLPLDESSHKEDFDWGVHDTDVAELAKAIGGRVVKSEMYTLEEIGRSYTWVEIQR